jgi:FAD/FMN-containing dehydrogenase
VTGHPALLAALAEVVGPANLLTEPGDLASYASDGRGTTGVPLAVVRPSDSDQVVRIVRLANAAQVRLVPQGARTGLVAAGIAGPGGDAIVLTLERLARPPVIDPINRTVEVDAGVPLSAVNAAAAEHGLFFPIDLGADPSVGGMIAANTGGARFLRYGDVRRNLLGIELVTADATPRALRLGAALWKNNVGLDLKQLIVGSSGSLGIVTRATLALAPKPVVTVSAMLALDRAESATELLIALEQAFGMLLTAFEGISGAALDTALNHVPRLRDPFGGVRPDYAVLIELSAGAAFDAEMLEERLGSVLMPCPRVCARRARSSPATSRCGVAT